MILGIFLVLFPSLFLEERNIRNQKERQAAKTVKNNAFEPISGRPKTGTVGVRKPTEIGLDQGRLAGKVGTHERIFCPR
jgi:hypothetical protein